MSIVYFKKTVCEPVDYNPDPSSRPYRMAGVVWVAYLFR